jgi:putative ABC transport system substrate-binding protein
MPAQKARHGHSGARPHRTQAGSHPGGRDEAAGVHRGSWRRGGCVAHCDNLSGCCTAVREGASGGNPDTRRNRRNSPLQAFRKRIRDLGYIDGQTIVLDFRFAKGNLDALPDLAAELVRTPVDVIVTDGTNATLAAFGATRTIPIVMATTGGDPIALGLATTIAQPGGNATGLLFRSFELSARRIARVTVLVNPTSTIGPPGLRATEDAAKLLRITTTALAAGNPDELRALSPAAFAGSGGLIVVNDATFWNNRAAILALALRSRNARPYL